MENNDLFKKLAEKYPFLTVCRYADEEFVGIIQNRDATITSMYNFEHCQIQSLRNYFLCLVKPGGGNLIDPFQ